MSDSLTVNGTLYNLSDEAGLNSLAADVQAMPESEPIVIENVVVFQPGWNRKGTAPHPKELTRYAKTAKGTPVLYYHDPSHLMGASLSMRHDKERGLVQSMKYDDPMMRRMLSMKIMPRFSIGWLPTQDTKLECSKCHKEMVPGGMLAASFGLTPKEGECPHYPGQKLDDGTEIQGLWTGVEHAETSVVFHPASLGTGLSYADDQLAEMVLKIKLYKEGKMNEPTATSLAASVDTDSVETVKAVTDELATLKADRDELTLALADKTAALDALSTKLTELTTELTASRTQLDAYRTAERQTKVRAYRERKALQGSEADILAMYEQIGPEAFDRLMAAVPDSQLAHVVTGIQPPAPVEVTDDKSLREAALAMERDTKRPYAECLVTIRNSMNRSK